MNVTVVVDAVKGFAVSEGGKSVVKVAKTVGNKLLVGITAGAGAGALVAGTRIGYKIAKKGIPAVLKPVEQILDKIVAGEPDFTVTFHKVGEPVNAEETTEEAQNTEPTSQE